MIKLGQLDLKLDFEIVLQAIEAILVSSTLRLSGEYGISQSSVVDHLHRFSKNIQNCLIVPHYQIIAKLFTSK